METVFIFETAKKRWYEAQMHTECSRLNKMHALSHDQVYMDTLCRQGVLIPVNQLSSDNMMTYRMNRTF